MAVVAPAEADLTVLDGEEAVVEMATRWVY